MDKLRPATESSELVKGNACTIKILETAVFALEQPWEESWPTMPATSLPLAG